MSPNSSDDWILSERDAAEQAAMGIGCIRRFLGGLAGCFLGLVAGLALGVFFGIAPRLATFDFHYTSFWLCTATGTILGAWLPKPALFCFEAFWFLVRNR